MASPTVVAVAGNPAKSSLTTAATSWPVGLPASIAAGELLLLYMRCPTGSLISTTPTGWTRLINHDISDATDDSTEVWYRWADGTEGTSLTVTPGSSSKFAALCWRISGAANPATQAPEVSTIQTYTTAANAADPPALSPTGGSKTYLFFAMMGLDSETVSASPPSGYGVDDSNTGTAGAVASNCYIAAGYRAATTATENPGAFTHAAANAGGNAFTIAIHPPGATVSTKTGYGKENG